MQTRESAFVEGRPSVSVIIPTYNRSASLLQCLAHLERQTQMDFEAIVMDDGSTDDTQQRVEAYAQTSKFPVRYLFQTNSGQARGRNVAIAAAQAPVSILIGDDIFPEAQFIQTHLDWHRRRPELEAVAVGFTRWSEQGQIVTPFMRWLESDGVQFAYGDLNRGVQPSWKHFYTSNLSFKTACLQLHPFDESFQRYGMEDIELGYRLATAHGLIMGYLPGAIANHLHPTTFEQSCDRAVHVGAQSFRFHQIWPEHRRTKPHGMLARGMVRVLTEHRIVLPVLKKLAAAVTSLWCPNPLIQPVLALHQKLGYDRAARIQGSSQDRAS